ncbi:hypothetical protein N657DRAFT_645072 [Parathielavia appendiculata]|uniref:Uncharacterized protein n=1 Tax=Parathielavia appendiculata TaxID=2587402 RepID=A0AAN6Z2S6_9PEZI|nr:hypothetical protein N657DRAFT_645072 [Parathielavia appendiculata]
MPSMIPSPSETGTERWEHTLTPPPLRYDQPVRPDTDMLMPLEAPGCSHTPFLSDARLAVSDLAARDLA